MSLMPATVRALAAAGLDPGEVEALVRRAVAEDLPDGPAGALDVTSAATVDATLRGRAEIVARVSGVVAGLPVAGAVFEAVGAGAAEGGTGGVERVGGDGGDGGEEAGRGRAGGGELTIAMRAADGDRVERGTVVLAVEGPVRVLLTAERTALNLLCHLSGVATLTRAWVDAVRGTGAAVRDTRKTMPGLRALEKYAVRCGGGVNHRMSLSDAALVKDNHVLAAGGVAAAFAAVRARFPDLPLEVECDTAAQVREAVAAGADLILCDNMSLDELREAVGVARPAGARLEASGGLTLDRARAVAETGVDFLAVGALTHSAPALDLGLDLRADLGSGTTDRRVQPAAGGVR